MIWSHTTVMYSLYLLLSIAVTIWVARTLFKNGRIFLVDAFHQNEGLADSVNHLLVVGFYLINIGFIALFLATDNKPQSIEQVFERLAMRMGIVLLTLGGMHFINILIFSRIRSRARLFAAPPPVAPTERLTLPA